MSTEKGRALRNVEEWADMVVKLRPEGKSPVIYADRTSTKDGLRDAVRGENSLIELVYGRLGIP